MPQFTKNVPKSDGTGGELHRQLLKMLDARITLATKGCQYRHAEWAKAENSILAYIPETELDGKRRAARENAGEPKYTTIKLPYTYALVLTAHTYLSSVFFARSPVHQFSGRHGEGEQQVQALEAVINYQTTVGEMLAPYYIWLYDPLKYGIGIIEEYWDNEVVQFSQYDFEPDPNDPSGENMLKVQATVKMPGYQGNRICNISPFDFLPDPRVSVTNYQKGEFVFVKKTLSWESIVRRKAQGYYMNIEHLKQDKGAPAEGGGETNSQLRRPSENIGIVDIEDQEHPSTVDVYEGCVTVIPSEWKLGTSDYPEKWMFTLTQDKGTIIGVQPHGAMHCKYPYAVLESEVEGYGTFNRGLPEIAEPLQNTMDWLINQHFFNVRAALNNQFIIDPSKIVARDAEKGGPGFVYRIRPEAYGQDIKTFFHQIPVNDVTRTHVGDLQAMFSFGERAFGINDQMFGVMSGSGRKTATEVRTSTGFGVNRLKTMAEYMSATGFAQHSQRLVQMTQQYMSAGNKFKIAGTQIMEMGPAAANQFLNVDPQAIQGFYDFVPVDGTLPVDKLALANLWKELLLQMRTVPGLIQQYDLGRIFAHVASLAGVRNLQQFKIELGSPQQLLQQADAGNIVPIGAGRSPGAGGGSNSRGVPASSPVPAPAY